MLRDLDWALPELKLNTQELLLLDWVLCPASGLIPGAEVETLVKGWESTRNQVWALLSKLPPDGGEGGEYRPFSLRELDAKFLLGVVPTTFRWGTGADCGFSLKRRLYLFIQGVVPPEDLPKEEPANV
jgi:hypothetical protein